jgi:hypothetical protein
MGPRIFSEQSRNVILYVIYDATWNCTTSVTANESRSLSISLSQLSLRSYASFQTCTFSILSQIAFVNICTTLEPIGVSLTMPRFYVHEDPEPATKGARSSSSNTELPRRTVPLARTGSRFSDRSCNVSAKHSLDALNNVEEGENEEGEGRPVDKLAVGLSDKDGEQGKCNDLNLEFDD